MVAYLHESLNKRLSSGTPLKHKDIEAATIEGAVQRLRPKLMTATTVLASHVWQGGHKAFHRFGNTPAAPSLQGSEIALESAS